MSSELFGKLETEVEINAPAAKYHELFTRRPHHLSSIRPDRIQSCELLEGQWGRQGSVIYWNYCYDGKTTVATDLIEAVDDEKNSVTFKVIDGPLLEHYKSFRLIVEATPKGDGNSLVHLAVEYEKLHDQVSDPHSLLQFVADLSKDMGAHSQLFSMDSQTQNTSLQRLQNVEKRIVKVLELAGSVMDELANPTGPRRESINNHVREFMQLIKDIQMALRDEIKSACDYRPFEKCDYSARIANEICCKKLEYVMSQLDGMKETIDDYHTAV